jgi:hypothetical protein
MAVATLTDSLIEAKLKETLVPKFNSHEFRLSESKACPRMRVLRVLGYIPADHDLITAGYFERGRIMEEWVARLYTEAYPHRTRRQVEVKTPFGDTGHIDIFFLAERRIVEVKSVGPSVDIPKEEHIWQVQAYLHFFKDASGERKADTAEIVYVREGSLKTNVYPVYYRADVGLRIERELEELHKMAGAQKLPAIPYEADEFPCSFMTRDGEQKCPWFEYCHDHVLDTTIPEKADEALTALIDEYANICIDLKKTAGLEERKKALQAQMAALMGEGTDFTSPKGSVKRTYINGRTTYDMEAAIQCGVVPQEALAPFTKTGAGYWKWTVKR